MERYSALGWSYEVQGRLLQASWGRNPSCGENCPTPMATAATATPADPPRRTSTPTASATGDPRVLDADPPEKQGLHCSEGLVRGRGPDHPGAEHLRAHRRPHPLREVDGPVRRLYTIVYLTENADDGNCSYFGSIGNQLAEVGTHCDRERELRQALRSRYRALHLRRIDLRDRQGRRLHCRHG